MSRHTLMVPVKVKPGCSTEFETLLSKVIANTRKEAGCVYYRTFKISDTEYFFIEEWADDQVMEAHNNAAHLKTFLAAIEPLVEGELTDTALTEMFADL